MGSGNMIQKTIFYIFIQMITLWSIFHQMTSVEVQNRLETTGLMILTGVFFLYAYKTVTLLSQNQSSYNEEERKARIY